jgi:hypothetical protein
VPSAGLTCRRDTLGLGELRISALRLARRDVESAEERHPAASTSSAVASVGVHHRQIGFGSPPCGRWSTVTRTTVPLMIGSSSAWLCQALFRVSRRCGRSKDCAIVGPGGGEQVGLAEGGGVAEDELGADIRLLEDTPRSCRACTLLRLGQAPRYSTRRQGPEAAVGTARW